MNKTTFSFRITDQTKNALKEISAKYGLPISALLTIWIQEKIEEENNTIGVKG